MTTLTLAINEEVLRKARIRAMQRGTSVNALIRDYLERVAGESHAAEGIAEFLAASR
jgi:predicted HicB family RNase H-like nuclease